jgi:hypothetical protein
MRRTAALSDCEHELARTRTAVRELSEARGDLQAVLHMAALGWTLVHGVIVYHGGYSAMIGELHAKEILKGDFVMAEYQTLEPEDNLGNEIEDRYVIAFEDAKDAVEFKLRYNVDT